MLITGVWFKDWAIQHGKAQLLAGLRLVLLNEVFLYRQIRAAGELPTALDSTVYKADGNHLPALHVIAEVVASQTDGFEPEVIIGFAGEANRLSALWPHALRLHVERGHFAKSPYPFSLYFDHLGTYGRSAIAKIKAKKLAYPIASHGSALVSAFRSTMAASLKSLDPFAAFDLRAHFDRIFLLPLQISNEIFFDAQCQYRTQFEFLYDVLAATPPDVGVVVTEHPYAEPVLRRIGTSANLELLRRSFPNMIFFEDFRLHQTPSQFLVPRVDGVWSVSSSVAYQALLFDGTVGSPQDTEISHVADATTFEGFFNQLGHRESNKAEAFLAWLLERYLVPAALFTDGQWLCDYLQRRVEAVRSAVNPIDGFVATADADRLMDAWTAQRTEMPPKAFRQWDEDPMLSEMLADRTALRNERAALRNERAALRNERDALLNSTSWRITSPLRRLKQVASGWRLGQAWQSDALERYSDSHK
jgi:hypothetical protein